MNVEAKEIQSGNLAAQKFDSFNCNLKENFGEHFLKNQKNKLKIGMKHIQT